MIKQKYVLVIKLNRMMNEKKKVKKYGIKNYVMYFHTASSCQIFFTWNGSKFP